MSPICLRKESTNLMTLLCGPDVEVPEAWAQVPDCALPLKKEVPQADFAKEGLLREAWAPSEKPWWASEVKPTRPVLRPPWSCIASVQSGLLGRQLRKLLILVIRHTLGTLRNMSWSGGQAGSPFCRGPHCHLGLWWSQCRRLRERTLVDGSQGTGPWCHLSSL